MDMQRMPGGGGREPTCRERTPHQVKNLQNKPTFRVTPKQLAKINPSGCSTKGNVGGRGLGTSVYSQNLENCFLHFVYV